MKIDTNGRNLQKRCKTATICQKRYERTTYQKEVQEKKKQLQPLAKKVQYNSSKSLRERKLVTTYQKGTKQQWLTEILAKQQQLTIKKTQDSNNLSRNTKHPNLSEKEQHNNTFKKYKSNNLPKSSKTASYIKLQNGDNFRKKQKTMETSKNSRTAASQKKYKKQLTQKSMKQQQTPNNT